MSCDETVAHLKKTSAHSVRVPRTSSPHTRAPASMPAIGLGTGAYGSTKGAYGAYPECEMEIVSAHAGSPLSAAVVMALRSPPLLLSSSSAHRPAAART